MGCTFSCQTSLKQLIDDHTLCQDAVIPSQIKQCHDLAIRELPTWKKVVLASIIQDNLLQKVKPTLTIEDFSSSDINPCLTFKNHFIIQNESKLHIYDMQTKHKTSLKEKWNRGFLGVHANKPWLIGFHLKEVLIWDFDLLKTGEKESFYKYIQKRPCYSNPSLDGTPNPGPVANTSGHILAIAFGDGVTVTDCNTWSEVQIPFKRATQIQFTDTHLMLASFNDIQVYEMSVLLQRLEQKEPVDLPLPLFSYRSEEAIYSTKIEKDQIVVILREVKKIDDSFITGRVINWQKTSEEVVNLIHPDDPTAFQADRNSRINCIDFCRNQIFAYSSSNLCRWEVGRSEPIMKRNYTEYYESNSSVDDCSQSEPVKKRVKIESINERLLMSMQVIGKYVLNFFFNRLEIVNHDFEVVKICEGYFELIQGRFLVQWENSDKNPTDIFKLKNIRVYDLGKSSSIDKTN